MIISMVRAGEETGTLDEILVKIADFLEKKYRFKNRIKGIMSYPLFMLVVSVAVVIFMLSFSADNNEDVCPDKYTVTFTDAYPYKTSHLFKIGWLYIIAGLSLIYAEENCLHLKWGRDKGFYKISCAFVSNILLKRELAMFPLLPLRL